MEAAQSGRTAGLYAQSCPAVIRGVLHIAVEKKGFDVLYSIDGDHGTFKRWTALIL